MYDTEWERLHNVSWIADIRILDCRQPHLGLQTAVLRIADIPVAVVYARQTYLHRSGKFSIFALPCMKSGKDITSLPLFFPFTHKKKSEKGKNKKKRTKTRRKR